MAKKKHDQLDSDCLMVAKISRVLYGSCSFFIHHWHEGAGILCDNQEGIFIAHQHQIFNLNYLVTMSHDP